MKLPFDTLNIEKTQMFAFFVFFSCDKFLCFQIILQFVRFFKFIGAHTPNDYCATNVSIRLE